MHRTLGLSSPHTCQGALSWRQTALRLPTCLRATVVFFFDRLLLFVFCSICSVQQEALLDSRARSAKKPRTDFDEPYFLPSSAHQVLVPRFSFVQAKRIFMRTGHLFFSFAFHDHGKVAVSHGEKHAQCFGLRSRWSLCEREASAGSARQHHSAAPPCRITRKEHPVQAQIILRIFREQGQKGQETRVSGIHGSLFLRLVLRLTHSRLPPIRTPLLVSNFCLLVIPNLPTPARNSRESRML